MDLTIDKLEKFINDPVWKIFKQELGDMRLIVFETLVGLSDSNEMLKMAGRAEVLGDIISWPEVQLANLEVEDERERKRVSAMTHNESKGGN